MIEILLIIGLIASGLIQLAFWLIIFSRIIFYKDISLSLPQENVSVVVAAKNEEKNIFACIKAIAREKSPVSEIIVIDDYSSDKTPSLIQKLCADDDRIKYLKPSKNLPGKKLALTEAIMLATSKLVLLTDADCIPASHQWAAHMSSNISYDKQIVLGYSPTLKSPGLVNLWSRFETWLTAVQYLSFSLAGMPYMGVGRNLLYSKSLFVENSGFNSHSEITSGDDDLFINQVSTKSNMAICLSPESFVYTLGPTSFHKYILQKKRHYSVSHKYKTKHIILLSLFSISHIMLYFSAIVFLFYGNKMGISILIFVLGIKWLVAIFCMKKMKESLWILFPLLDIALVIYYITMSPFLLLKSKSW